MVWLHLKGSINANDQTVFFFQADHLYCMLKYFFAQMGVFPYKMTPSLHFTWQESKQLTYVSAFL